MPEATLRGGFVVSATRRCVTGCRHAKRRVATG